MTNARRFTLDELTLRPGSYFNPQTEIMIIVDDSPEFDHEIFGLDEFDAEEWLLVSDEVPTDENKRDELIERFQQTYQPSGELGDEDIEVDEDDLLDDEEEDDEDELDGVEELELDRE